MACIKDISTLDQISYDCNTAFGGILSVVFSGGGKTWSIEFNDKDAYSNYEEVKTASLDGTTSCIQTLSLEVPRFDKAEKVMAFSNPNMKFKVDVTTKSGKIITMGKEFGASLKTSDAASGAQKTDKSRVQLQFVAEEINLAEIKDASLQELSAVDESRAKFTQV